MTMTDSPAAPTKKRCFVISPIGRAGSDTRRHADMVLNSIIRPALPDFDVRRADDPGKPQMITDKMIEALFNSELAVADLSFLNANVFYELGIRHMKQLPVIPIAVDGTELPFDNYGADTIWFDPFDWHRQQKAQNEIRATAEAALADSARVSNPVTQALGSLRLANSADTTEMLVAQLSKQVAQLSKQVVEFDRRLTLQTNVLAKTGNFPLWGNATVAVSPDRPEVISSPGFTTIRVPLVPHPDGTP